MKKTHAIAAATAVAAILVLTSYASPYWTLHQMKTAIADKDADQLSEHIDFPALRESFKGQMMTMMNKRMSSPEMANNPFSGVGQMMAVALINPLIDAAVSPAGVLAMMESGKVQPAPQQTRKADPATPQDKRDYLVSYQSWSKVAVSQTGQDTGRFILKRTGLWSWQLSALELPGSLLEPGK
ncbi:MAG: DUF2939 domain-containing protein [Pseudomonadota bacterium]